MEAGRLPLIATVGGYDVARPNAKIFPRQAEWKPSWDIGVNLTWSLFDGGRVRAEAAEAAANQRAAEEKARTALLTREPSRIIAARTFEDLATQGRMQQFGLNPQQGGYPIIVNDQMIGAIGVGGGAGGEELCARYALEQVFGPQPPITPAPALSTPRDWPPFATQSRPNARRWWY